MKLIRCTTCGKRYKVDILNEDCEVENFCCEECEMKFKQAKEEVAELDKRFGVGT